MEIKVGPWRMHVVCHPDLAHHVLTADRIFDKGGPMFNRTRKLIGDGLASCLHDQHRRQRRLVQPAFHRTRMPRYARAMTEHIAAVTGSWRDGQLMDLGPEMTKISTGVLAKTIFTADFCGPAIAAVPAYSEMIQRGLTRRLLTPAMLQRLPTRGKRRFERVTRELESAVSAMAERYRHDGVDRGDLMSILLASRDEDGSGLTDAEIYAEIVTMILAGTETVAYTLSHAFRLLQQHPEIEARLHTEVDEVLGGRPASWDDLPSLDLAGRVFKETLRLAPSDWIVTRVVTEDTELAGCALPAGSIVAFCGLVIHQRADLYPQPASFLPDRWLDQQLKPPSGAFIPFGEGGRKCIGDVFGTVEGILALSTIAARWRFERTEPGRTRSALRIPGFTKSAVTRVVARHGSHAPPN
ncbi:cytochrome P450 [Streptomyces sp. NPDC046215]|uniref:cytochrome P450 n=1 Tax=Streptomyces TaxID=1883 RepID=UPI0031D9ED6A